MWIVRTPVCADCGDVVVIVMLLVFLRLCSGGGDNNDDMKVSTRTRGAGYRGEGGGV